MIAEDLDDFMADWGLPCEIDGTPATAIFGAPGQPLPLGASGMAGSSPRALIPAAAVPALDPYACEDRRLVFTPAAPAGYPAAWRIREVQPDGTGMATLILTEHEAAD